MPPSVIGVQDGKVAGVVTRRIEVIPNAPGSINSILPPLIRKKPHAGNPTFSSSKLTGLRMKMI